MVGQQEKRNKTSLRLSRPKQNEQSSADRTAHTPHYLLLIARILGEPSSPPDSGLVNILKVALHSGRQSGRSCVRPPQAHLSVVALLQRHRPNVMGKPNHRTHSRGGAKEVPGGRRNSRPCRRIVPQQNVLPTAFQEVAVRAGSCGYGGEPAQDVQGQAQQTQTRVRATRSKTMRSERGEQAREKQDRWLDQKSKRWPLPPPSLPRVRTQSSRIFSEGTPCPSPSPDTWWTALPRPHPSPPPRRHCVTSFDRRSRCTLSAATCASMALFFGVKHHNADAVQEGRQRRIVALLFLVVPVPAGSARPAANDQTHCVRGPRGKIKPR